MIRIKYEEHSGASDSISEENDPNCSASSLVLLDTLNLSLVQLGEFPVDYIKIK